MRWLLLKDLQILRRSPLLVALLVLYPIVIAVLIGFALSRGPDKPEVAFYNGLAGQSAVVELGGERIDLASEGRRLFDGPPRELERVVGTTGLDFEEAFVEFLHRRGH